MSSKKQTVLQKLLALKENTPTWMLTTEYIFQQIESLLPEERTGYEEAYGQGSKDAMNEERGRPPDFNTGKEYFSSNYIYGSVINSKHNDCHSCGETLPEGSTTGYCQKCM